MPSRVNTRDIRPIVALVSTDLLKMKGNAKEVHDNLFFGERQKCRGQVSKSQK